MKLSTNHIVSQSKRKIQIYWKDNYFKAAIGLFGISLFLRFYKISGFLTFLGDQGRDAIILKRIVTLEHFPAIGATTSIGQIFLGPFYYYFIAPWLLFSNFNPVGPAIGVAIFSSLFVIFSFLAIKPYWNKPTAIVFASFVCFSAILVDFSRYSWNPNLLPLFSFMTFYFLARAINEKRNLYFILLGTFLALSIQLHYIALGLLPAVTIVLIVDLILDRPFPKYSSVIKWWGSAGVAFLIFMSPLFIFDLRHNFLNSKNFINLLFGGETVGTSNSGSLFDTLVSLHEFALPVNQPQAVVIFSLISIIVGAIYLLTKDKNSRALGIFFIVQIIVTAMFSGVKHAHYLGSLFPFYYLIAAIFLSKFFGEGKKRWFLVIVIILFAIFNSNKFIFLHEEPGNQTLFAKKVATVVYENVGSPNFQVTGLPNQYSDSTYRYYLEIWDKRSLEKDSLDRADELFVICEGSCSPVGNPQWDIAFFAPTKIVGSWKVENVTIYKLIREPQ